MSAVDRVAARAAEVRVARVLLSVLMSPLFAVGFVVGMVWVALLWLYAAAAEGFIAGRAVGPVATAPTEAQ